MQYVRSISGSVSKTWNSINPANLSGAIDVIVVEQEDGSLACSPFHVRFGKFQLLRPSEKKVEFKVNGVAQDYAMKLGEGGEAFFVFETSESIPEALQTSPLVSPASSPELKPVERPGNNDLVEPKSLALDPDGSSLDHRRSLSTAVIPSLERRAQSDLGEITARPDAPEDAAERPKSGDWSGHLRLPVPLERSTTDDILPSAKVAMKKPFNENGRSRTVPPEDGSPPLGRSERSTSPPPLSKDEAFRRAKNLQKKLWNSNIHSEFTEQGDLMLDMTGYKSNEEDLLRGELTARKLLAEEIEGNYDIGALIGADDKGNLWIYSSEEAKAAAAKQASLQGFRPEAMRSTDAISDPGYHSDDGQSDSGTEYTANHIPRDSDSAVGLSSPPKSPRTTAGDPNRNYAKTLRLTSDQLKAMDLKPGANTMSFSVNRATCSAFIYLWEHSVPVVISDIDGTITKSDALGHLLNAIGRDWTHLGVAKLYTDIAANGYNILYLTSRSVGQADTTRAYLNSVVQDGYRLPKGPTIMSPDRTLAALRREIYLRKPEVFKMACLRDIMTLYSTRTTPFYAGFGNRLTDALSYRSVNIPSTRIFTINSNAEVSLDLLSLNKYKTGYASMREIVDHYFPPVGMLVQEGAEEYTDFRYWREPTLALEDFSASESEDDDEDIIAGNDGDLDGEASIRSEDEADIETEDMEASYFSRESFDTGVEDPMEQSIMESIEGDYEDEEDGGVELEDDEIGGDELEWFEDGEEEDEDAPTPGALADEGDEDGEDAPTPGSLADNEGTPTRQIDALDLADDDASEPKTRANDVREDLRELASALNSPERTRRRKALDRAVQQA